MNTNDLTVYVAEMEGEPAGTVTVMLMPNITYGCAPTLFIEAVVVVPEHRRRGVASRILDRVLEDAAANGCDKVQLLSHKRHANDGGHALYAKAGFTAEAEGFRLYLRRSRPLLSPLGDPARPGHEAPPIGFASGSTSARIARPNPNLLAQSSRPTPILSP